MPSRQPSRTGWNSLLLRYSADLVKLAEQRRGEAMLALARQEAILAAEAQAAMTRAEEANRAKDEFLAHISHELRTPLNAIIGFSEMIERQLDGVPEGEKILAYIRDINSSGWHLNRVVNDLLDYAKFQAGKLQVLEEEVDFAKTLQACYTMVKGRLEEKRIVFQRDLAKVLPVLFVDELKLKQILINLLSNAVKFTPDGGAITVEASVGATGRFVMRVRDTGIGIPAEDIANVFLPFYQLDSKLTRKYEGTGLGLPLTKALIELHGGSIAIESAPGLGTTVTVEVPAERVLLFDASRMDEPSKPAAVAPTGKAA
jgi:signal transduction histidine kinase